VTLITVQLERSDPLTVKTTQ